MSIWSITMICWSQTFWSRDRVQLQPYYCEMQRKWATCSTTWHSNPEAQARSNKEWRGLSIDVSSSYPGLPSNMGARKIWWQRQGTHLLQIPRRRGAYTHYSYCREEVLASVNLSSCTAAGRRTAHKMFTSSFSPGFTNPINYSTFDIRMKYNR